MTHPPVTSGTVLGIWAHPDDETYLAGGLMGRAADAGHHVVCVTATRGEHGTADPAAWPPQRLAPLREHELRASLAVLGVAEHEFLDLSDGTCNTHDEETQVERLAGIVNRVRPATIVTFGPEGYTGHEDHRTISRWATAAQRRAAPHATLLYAACPEDRAHRWADVHRRLHVFLTDDLPVTTPAAAIAVEVRLDDAEADRKLTALRAHASQTASVVAELGEDTFRAWVAVESFTDAGSPDPPTHRPSHPHPTSPHDTRTSP